MTAIVTDCNSVNWNELARLIERAGLGARVAETVERAFRGSYMVGFLYVDAKLVGAGRAISDGVTSSAIYDLVIAPEHQGQGHGGRILKDMLARLPARSVLLLSVPKQVGFYEKAGFKVLKTAMLKHEDMGYWLSNGYLAEEGV